MDYFLEYEDRGILSYGQTGAGKTYSLFGEQEVSSFIEFFSRELFKEIDQKKTEVHVSFFQIYLDQISDLVKAFADELAKKSIFLSLYFPGQMRPEDLLERPKIETGIIEKKPIFSKRSSLMGRNVKI